jgi:beta-glucosidase
MCGGTAVAEVIYGRVNPSGRLPISVPRSVGHVRSAYHHRPAAHHRSRFRFSPSEPLFPFGHGLSYSTFEYLGLRASGEIGPGASLDVEVTLRNSGPRAGEEVVLLFVSDVIGSVTRPVRTLRGFRRVHLEPEQTATVALSLDAAAFALLDRNLEPVIERGEFRLSVGSLEHAVWARETARLDP